MSREEIVREYAGGLISRRTLIRRLVATGVSFGAAVSYAHLLKEERAWARGFDPHHGGAIEPLTGKILQQDLDDVIANEKLKVRFSVPRRGQVEFKVYLRRPERLTGAYALIGFKEIQTDGPVTRKTVNVPLKVNPPHSVDALRPLTSADLDLVTVARRNRDPQFGSAPLHQRTISK